MFAVPENTIPVSIAPVAKHPLAIAAELARDESRWRNRLRFDPAARFVSLLEHTDEYEAWLLTWLPGQSTELHTHGNATGAFRVVSGVLTEQVMRTNETLALEPGQTRVFAPHYVHQVSNNGSEPAVSIHVYRPVREVRLYP
jgi:quercetin dioxygenase-like cupin family protein